MRGILLLALITWQGSHCQLYGSLGGQTQLNIGRTRLTAGGNINADPDSGLSSHGSVDLSRNPDGQSHGFGIGSEFSNQASLHIPQNLWGNNGANADNGNLGTTGSTGLLQYISNWADQRITGTENAITTGLQTIGTASNVLSDAAVSTMNKYANALDNRNGNVPNTNLPGRKPDRLTFNIREEANANYGNGAEQSLTTPKSSLPHESYTTANPILSNQHNEQASEDISVGSQGNNLHTSIGSALNFMGGLADRIRQSAVNSPLTLGNTDSNIPNNAQQLMQRPLNDASSSIANMAEDAKTSIENAAPSPIGASNNGQLTRNPSSLGIGFAGSGHLNTQSNGNVPQQSGSILIDTSRPTGNEGTGSFLQNNQPTAQNANSIPERQGTGITQGFFNRITDSGSRIVNDMQKAVGNTAAAANMLGAQTADKAQKIADGAIPTGNHLQPTTLMPTNRGDSALHEHLTDSPIYGNGGVYSTSANSQLPASSPIGASNNGQLTKNPSSMGPGVGGRGHLNTQSNAPQQSGSTLNDASTPTGDKGIGSFLQNNQPTAQNADAIPERQGTGIAQGFFNRIINSGNRIVNDMLESTSANNQLPASSHMGASNNGQLTRNPSSMGAGVGGSGHLNIQSNSNAPQQSGSILNDASRPTGNEGTGSFPQNNQPTAQNANSIPERQGTGIAQGFFNRIANSGDHIVNDMLESTSANNQLPASSHMGASNNGQLTRNPSSMGAGVGGSGHFNIQSNSNAPQHSGNILNDASKPTGNEGTGSFPQNNQPTAQNANSIPERQGTEITQGFFNRIINSGNRIVNDMQQAAGSTAAAANMLGAQTADMAQKIAHAAIPTGNNKQQTTLLPTNRGNSALNEHLPDSPIYGNGVESTIAINQLPASSPTSASNNGQLTRNPSSLGIEVAGSGNLNIQSNGNAPQHSGSVLNDASRPAGNEATGGFLQNNQPTAQNSDAVPERQGTGIAQGFFNRVANTGNRIMSNVRHAAGGAAALGSQAIDTAWNIANGVTTTGSQLLQSMIQPTNNQGAVPNNANNVLPVGTSSVSTTQNDALSRNPSSMGIEVGGSVQSNGQVFQQPGSMGLSHSSQSTLGGYSTGQPSTQIPNGSVSVNGQVSTNPGTTGVSLGGQLSSSNTALPSVGVNAHGTAQIQPSTNAGAQQSAAGGYRVQFVPLGRLLGLPFGK